MFNTATATATQPTVAPYTWDDMPDRLPWGDWTRPYIAAVIDLHEDGIRHVVGLARSKYELMKLIRQREAWTGREHFRALLPVCLKCSNLGHTDNEGSEYCECVAGDALKEYQEAVWDAEELAEYDPLTHGPTSAW